ncbi:MAG: tetratricopeptide repeat protein [Clostridiales bacterium]|nr:tetratricopeptide repeat protein [Clostridiales bacterium]
MSNINSDSYQTVDWILNRSEYGFYFLIASANMQRKAVERYYNSSMVVYDYAKYQKSYSFVVVDDFIKANPGAKTYFLLNFQLAIQEDGERQKLNFSRDMLASLEKNIIFCITPNADDVLAGSAFDFYSYIKLRVFFEDESEKRVEEQFSANISVDLSTGLTGEIEIDFSASKMELLTQAIALMNQAERLLKEHRYSDALALLWEALKIREPILGSQHPNTANTYQAIGDAYYGTAKYQEAQEWYGKALAIREKVLGKEHPDTAITYSSIANVYDNQEDYPKALELFEKALAIFERIPGKEQLDTADIYNNIANVCNKQADFVKALVWHEKALAIKERVLGKEHPDTAITYNNIANVYNKQGDYAKALKWHEKALAVREKLLGKEHLDTAATYNNIANTYKSFGDSRAAFKLYEKALDVFSKVLGSDHPYSSTVRENMILTEEEK